MAADPVRVLLIEDNPEEATLTRLHLRGVDRPDYEVEHVQRLDRGLFRLSSGYRPDVVLLDLNLPDVDGLEGYRMLSERYPGIPVVMLTNVDDEETAALAVRRGAQDYLIKREVGSPLLRRVIRYAIERQRAERALRESEERYALAVSGANDCIWDWDKHGDSLYLSPRWSELTGCCGCDGLRPVEEWLGRVHAEDLEGLEQAMEHRTGMADHHFEYEHRLRREDGSFLWVLVRGLAVYDEAGDCIRLAGSMTNISHRKHAEYRLMYDALHDGLTGLPNRSLFTDRLSQALRRHKRDADLKFAALYFDLDRFKYINDSLGHSAGDELLVSISQRLSRFLRPGDTLARLGGDEFAILLNDIEDLADATMVADRIHELFKEEFVIQGHDVFTSASIGIAMSSSSYNDPDEVLRDADLAMYRAKHEGQRDTVIYDDVMHARALERLKLESDLHRAFTRNEFAVHYQPIFNVADGRIVAFEALLRWFHPARGLLLPDEFIETVEENGMITPLGWWTLEVACKQVREWQLLFPSDPAIGISVNVSGKLFRTPNMASRLLELVKGVDLEPTSLRLELTESSFMDHQAAVTEEMEKLRDAGVQFYVDDFGTGYSSLTYLQRFAYDTLKIDRSFIREMELGNGNEAIVQATIALGRMLGMNVIAEGVESESQLNVLRSLQCPEAQGFWFSKPLANWEVNDLLFERREPVQKQ